MKKINFTLLFVLGLFISSFAQMPYLQVDAHRKYAEFSQFKKDRFKAIPAPVKGTKSTPITTMYIDYDALSALGTANTGGFVWDFNNNGKVTNVSDSFMITKVGAAYAYSLSASGGGAADSIVGFTDYNDVTGSAKFYPYPASITIDSIFMFFTHENNSGLADTIGYQIVGLNTNGSLNTTSILNTDEDTTKTTISSGGNWLGTGAISEIDYGPGFTTTQKFGVTQIYKGPRQDTFGIIFTYLDDGAGNVAAASSMPYSFNDYIPFITNFSRSSGITASGNPYFFQDWLNVVKVSFQEPLNGNFTFTPGSPVTNASVTFNGSSNDPSATYSWNWADGSANSTGKNTAHTFTNAGTYLVDLTVTNGGETVSTQKNVVVGVNGVVTINNFEIGEVHPNPTTVGQKVIVPIKLKSGDNTAKVVVFNALGQELSNTTQIINNQAVINTSNLMTGVHFYTIQIGSQKMNGKFSVIE
jgi:PKD repeat protein